MGRIRHIVIVGLLVIVSTIALRYAFTFLFALPFAASLEAGPIDVLFNAHFWMIAFLFSLIMVIMLYAAFVFRREPGDETDGPHVHGNTSLEIGWTVVPTVVVLGFGVWGAIILNDITRPDPAEMVVEVTGRQWVWSFAYPEQGGFPSAELVLPVNQPILLKMNAEDVLHSFWVPEFRVKQDLVPGRETQLRITPTEAGEFDLLCAEICGQAHTQMVAPVRIVDEAEFVAWVDEKNSAPLFGEMTAEERGEFWHGAEGFGCVGCHSIDGSPGVGPTWQGLYLREEELTDGSTIISDDAYIENSIINTNDQIVAGYNPNIMPQNYAEQFAAREAEILATEGVEIDITADLIAFIKTLE